MPAQLRALTGDSRLVGVALAGGASRRMGRDKTRVRIAGQTLLERSVEVLAAVCQEVVVADGGRRLLPHAVSVDDADGRGPAAGILGAAGARPESDLLVLACDVPRVPAELLRAMTCMDGDWVVPAWDGEEGGEERLEPLCALYRRRALRALEEQVRRGIYAVHRLAETDGLDVHRLGDDALRAFGRPAEIFANVNTPADLAILRGNEPDG